MDQTVQQTAQDLKDAWKDELSQYQLNPRLTVADQKNDKQSVNRKLEETLVLLVEQTIGTKNHLLLPQGKRRPDETLRQTAERVLKEKCGPSIDVLFYGNAPCGFYKYKYPISEQKEAIGAKIFFFRATYQSGQNLQNDGKQKQIANKYEWLSKEELQAGAVNRSYSENISQFLL